MDCFLWGSVKSKVYTNKLTLPQLQQNVRNNMAAIQNAMSTMVHLDDIIFKKLILKQRILIYNKDFFNKLITFLLIF